MSQTAVRTAEHAHLKALLKLSDLKSKQTSRQIEAVTRKAPDPETAVQAVMKNLASHSPVLMEKWRKTIQALWALHHPGLPALPEIPVTEKSASATFALLDALSLLNLLADRPARLTHRGGDWGLSLGESKRLVKALESHQGLSTEATSDASLRQLQRLRATLEAARLIRPVQGELRVVSTRLRQFLDLPRSYQFYVLWHADVYHVCWGDFARRWHDCITDIQDYLPLLWEVSEAEQMDTSVDKREWCLTVSSAFAPLWQSHMRRNIMQAVSSVGFFLHQNSLAATVNQLVVNDLFARYGLLQFERSGNFVWTPLGINLITAEANQTLPCGLELLS